MEKDKIRTLYGKYLLAKRSGWTEPGKRNKDNQAILVNRREVLSVMSELDSASWWMYQAFFYEDMLKKLAEDEHDTIECPKCHKEYREGWFDGKCPYCEVENPYLIAHGYKSGGGE